MPAKSARTILTGLVLLLAVVQAGTLVTPHVSASQVTSAAPTMWHTQQDYLSVRMVGGSDWARASVIRAMNEWNTQQEAFIQKYYPNETYSLPNSCATSTTVACVQSVEASSSTTNSYVFYEDENTATPMVTVIFSPVHSEQVAAIEHASSELAVTGFDGSKFTISVLSALTNVPDNETSSEVLYRVMLHEFGHVMGLGHIFDGKDIMDGDAYFIFNLSKKSYISTVDLYAVHYLAELGSGQLKPYSFIPLPNAIPYTLIDVDQ